MGHKADKSAGHGSPAAKTPAPPSETVAGTAPGGVRPGSREIEIVGARTHNLKNISTRIPHRRLTVITGVSGSGKSSLAFDTLYAEGQMRYVESMSAYSRQFLERMARPDVDRLTGILPAIALEQKNSVKNARSTIGTATEINDYLRLMYANAGETVCPHCQKPVPRLTVERAVERLREFSEGTPLVVTAEVGLEGMSSFASLKAEFERGGFTRVFLGEEIRRLDELHLEDFREANDHACGAGMAPGGVAPGVPAGPVRLEVVVDRFERRDEARSRAAEAMETAFKLGHGRARVRPAGGAAVLLDTRFVCPTCEREFLEPTPDLFSFNSALGACPRCEGFGRISGLDEKKIIPDPLLSLAQGAVAPWTTPAYADGMKYLRRAARRNHIDMDTPYQDLAAEAQRIVWDGDGDYPGIRGFFEWLETKRYKVHVRVMIARYRGYTTCPDCRGRRLRPEALAVLIGGKNFADLCGLAVKDLRTFLDALELPGEAGERARILLQAIRARLRYLDDVGLSYLTLDRQTRTLSGGEAQRINLASALGSSLTSTLYVLDEPTVGLHPRDSGRLLQILHQLIDKGNTVVVVEHDPEIIRGAHRVIDLGPGAGEAGGRIVFEGTFAELAASDSPTGRAMKLHMQRAISPYNRRPTKFLTVKGAREHNLKNVTVRIPLGVLACLTGVSGSGKSTLVHDILYAAWRRLQGLSTAEPGEHDEIEGWEAVDDVILVDQSPIGRSTRSNPVTYVKAYDEIRRLLAATTRARVAGIKAGDFSFNVPGGRCEECKGVGTLTFDMYFLADITVVCSQCNGKKFQKKILDIRYHGANIDDILDLTVREALAFFAEDRRIVGRLQPLADVGLGYLRLGQNTASLSGGEAQRLKLASFLAAQKGDKSYLLLFDEPTTGLHLSDVRVLLQVFQRLVNAGHSVLVIEHNLDLVTQSDWVIDLGPEGGDQGGEVVAAGPVRSVAKVKRSHTARFLRERIRAAETAAAADETVTDCSERGQTMKQTETHAGGTYVFGPVPSRRLGRSLGVDIVPRKVCTLDCVYCQVGRTTELTVQRGDFVPVEAVLAEVAAAIARGPRPDYVTISGSGEPTLNVRLGEIIAGVRKITDVPVAIITNGTLLGEAEVRRDCAGADLVAPSLDAGDEETYQRINRPTRGLTLAALVEGLAAFRKVFAGQYWLEVFFVAGVNDSPEQVAKMRGLIERINPDRVQVNTATRPTAESEVGAIPAARLAEIARELGPKAEVIAEFKAGAAKVNDHPQTSLRVGPGDGVISQEAALAMILRRPVTAEDIAAGLGAAIGEVERVVATLEVTGRIAKNRRGGKIYYEAAEKK